MNVMVTAFIVAGAVIVFVLYTRFNARELEHKEKLAALEKGVDLPVTQSAPWTPRTYLLHGMIWLFAGLASMIALIGVAATSTRLPTAEEKMHSVSIARANGATPEEIQMLLNDRRASDSVPVGLALLGLIPVSVGLAYLIFYKVENRKMLS